MHKTGAQIPIDAGTLVGAEGELAIRVADDVPAGIDLRDAARLVASVAPAVEVIAIRARFDDVTACLAENLWHESAILGSAVQYPTDLSEVDVRMSRNGEPASRRTPLAGNVDVPVVVRFVADATAAIGECLRGGDVIFSGLITAFPVWVLPGDHVHADFGTLGAVDVHFQQLEHGETR
jgi:2-oxo-hept-3-ene-1,7-dioate hydratase